MSRHGECTGLHRHVVPGHAPAAVGHELLDDRRSLGCGRDGVALVQDLMAVSRATARSST